MSLWDWHDHAACRGLPLALFFGTEREHQYEREARERRAKAICAGCPVVAECLATAHEMRLSGIWGGTSDEERAAQRRRGQRAAMTAARRAERVA